MSEIIIYKTVWGSDDDYRYWLECDYHEKNNSLGRDMSYTERFHVLEL